MKTLLWILWAGSMVVVLAIAVSPFYLTGQMIIDDPTILLRCPNFYAIIILTIQYVLSVKWSVS